MGAINHVNFYTNNFVTFCKINPIHINLPNGSHVIAHYDGRIELFENFLLYNVLNIPKFEFNLVFCVESLKLIRCARLNRGLYLIDTPKHEVIVNTTGEMKDEGENITTNI